MENYEPTREYIDQYVRIQKLEEEYEKLLNEEDND